MTRRPDCFTAPLRALACCLTFSVANAAVEVIGVQCHADRPFPEYECFWNDGGYPSACGTNSPMGLSAHLFLKNNNASGIALQDVQLAGVSVKQALTQFDQNLSFKPASVHLARSAGLITAQQLQDLVNAGEPVWYKFTPNSIPPGGTGQAIVRLRRNPSTQNINLNVIHSAGSTNVAVTVPTNQPALAGISFSSDLTRVYLYWRHAQPGQGPIQVLMDDVDVTANTITSTDAAINTSPSILQLASPLVAGSFHVFKGVFGDGQTAAAGLRVWSSELIYGMWGAKPGDSGDNALARAYLRDIAGHLINTVVYNLTSKAVEDYLETTQGRQLAASLGLGFVIDATNNWGVTNPRLFFIQDEPDAQLDPLVTGLADHRKIGTAGQWCVQKANNELGAGGSVSIPNLNIVDNVGKPYNFYNYGQLSDVLAVDPYYQVRLRKAYWEGPVRIPLYAKATYVYAMAQAGQAACEPNPLHITLYAASYTESGKTFPFPTPESKRIEAYYALAAGAKGLSYWWYVSPRSPSNGIGAGTPAALALWREIGLLGAEARTAGPLLVTSCPATLPIQNSDGLWVRSLLVGQDAIILLVVNDNYYNDATNCHYTPVNDASVTATLPAWIDSPTAFEITAGGIRNVTSQAGGGQFQVNLGTVNLTRMIVLTSNPQLRATLQQRYDQQYRTNVCVLAPELCVNIAPGIVVQPQNQTVEQGQNATFTVTANGTAPLSYQWRFDASDLADATDGSFTRFNAQTNDAGNYTVIITNAAGAITSAPGSLTVTAPIFCVPAGLVNGDFEGGNSGGVATGWTSYEVNAPTIKVWTMQTALPPVAGSQYQQIQAYNAALTASAGVRQTVTGCVIGATYQIAGWYRSNSDLGRARVRVSPNASTVWNTAIDLNPVADYGVGTTWATFSGTVVATGTSMTLWLDGRTISGTSAKVGCFDGVTVTCLGPTAPVSPPQIVAQRNGNNLTLTWPESPSAHLERTTSLSPPVSWTSVANLPTVDGEQKSVTITPTGSAGYYRLVMD